MPATKAAAIPATGTPEAPGRRVFSSPLASSKAPRVEIGLQQGELDQIVLCAAAADTLVLTGQGSERLYCRGEIAPFERGEASRQRR